jgi:trigger factor
MQVTETLSQGLKRELKVVVGASELSERFTTRLDQVKNEVQLKGFRKGKVPVAHLRKLFGRSVMAEVLQQTVEETSRQAVSDRNERLARQPDINLTEDKDEIERVLSGQSDLAFTMSYETLPEIAIADLAALKLEREVVDVAPEAVEKGLNDLLERSIRYEVEAERAAEAGDRLTLDFIGRIDGQEFEGGKGEDIPLVLGQGGFIPGFEDGLKGAKPGEERLVKAKFPDAYPQTHLAGKDVAFEVKVKEVAKPIRPELNDDFAKTLGVESLARLRELVAAKIGSEYASVSRMKLKRQILDALDKAHNFVLPEALVSGEFDMIWRQVTESLKEDNKTFAGMDKSEDELRAEYRKIAERRVRLGLVVGEIGEKSKLQVTQDELKRALIEQANRYPGQQKHVYEFYEKNPAALAELRAPIFEDKVIDHIVEQAKPVEKKVSVEELLKPVEGDDDVGLARPHRGHEHHDHDHGHDHDHHGHHHDHGHDHDHHHDHDHDHGQEKR